MTDRVIARCKICDEPYPPGQGGNLRHMKEYHYDEWLLRQRLAQRQAVAVHRQHLAQKAVDLRKNTKLRDPSRSFPLVIVWWMDSISNREWVGVEEIGDERPAMVTSVGWLVREASDYLTLGTVLGEDAAVGQRLHLPRGAVVKMEEIIGMGMKLVGKRRLEAE